MRIINQPPRGIGNAAQKRLLDEATSRGKFLWDVLPDALVVDGVDAKTADAVAQFRRLIERIPRPAAEKARSPQLVAQVIDKTAYRDSLAKLYPDPTERETRLASLEEIVNAAASYDKNRRAKSPPSLAGFLDDMLLNERDDSDEKESQLARNAVALMTLHSAKGLEFPRVYLVGMEEGILPHKRSLDDGERRGDRRRAAAVLRRRHAGPRAADALVRAHAPQMGQAAQDHPQPVPLRNDRPGRELPARRPKAKPGQAKSGRRGRDAQNRPTLALARRKLKLELRATG